MSTNKSQNLNLHLWEPEDNFLRTEFNENFAALDTIVNATKTTADAAYSPSLKPYATGEYTGNGETLDITLGFRPSFVIIGGQVSPKVSNTPLYQYFFITSGAFLLHHLKFTDTGFQVIHNEDYNPVINKNAKTYSYIAFR